MKTISITIPEEYYKSIVNTAALEGVSQTYIVKRALETEQYLRREERAGKKILIADGNKMERLIRR